MSGDWCGWPVVDEQTGWETAQQILTDAELSDGLPLVPPTRRRLFDDRPAAPLGHRAMRVQATVVPPNDGMKAECLPGPPATVMWMSFGSRPMVSQSPSGLWPVVE